ncbi:sulfotransferase family protein [Paenibacillus sp. GCM10023250]|uniref:sulfotransferase family protein n=1 Tax=Paenibacillus sp. GCM10023250 TaxID=3252648 RepID=UPI0036139D48
MISQDGTNLVFLLCTPRSGSSLLTTILQNHSAVFAAQEMWFLMGLYDLKVSPNRPYGGTGIVKRFYNGIVPDSIYDQACRKFALQIYNGLLQSGDARLILDKSPRYYCILEFLDRLFPQSKRVWLIRNPLAVLASYKKVYGGKGELHLTEALVSESFDMKINDVTVGMLRYLDYFALDHPCTYKLYYEQLVDRPREVIQDICEFLGIAYEEGIEKYGLYSKSTKADLFYSMGVGDPYVAQHQEVHRESVDSWKTVLDKKEIELYCRAIGAKIFRDLGYNDELEAAEQIVGTRFDMGPDEDMVHRRTNQLSAMTGCNWTDSYGIRRTGDVIQDKRTEESFVSPLKDKGEILRLQMAYRTLEQRLTDSYDKQQRIQAELERYRSKINRLKSLLPFSGRVMKWADHHLFSSPEVKR